VLAPIVSWQTTSAGLAPRTKMLTVAGVDVGSAIGGNSYGVDPESITVTEAAAGSVSSMSFTITDPAGAIAVNKMDPVVFWDITRDMPIFRGWVQDAPAARLGIGRTISVTAIGVEAVLDWAYVPTFTIPSATDNVGALQMIAAAAVGYNGVALNVAMINDVSTVAHPIEGATTGVSIASLGGGAFVVPSGTLRQALRAYLEWYRGLADIGTWAQAFWVTIDFWLGLRVWSYNPSNGTEGGSGDVFGSPTITTAGPIRPSDTEYSAAGGDVPRTAVVIGAAGAVTTVSDGTGLPGPTVVRTDTNATTPQMRAGIGAAMLASQASSVRGSTTVEGGLTLGTFAAQIRPGSPVDVLDAQAGVSPTLHTWLGSITKTYMPSGEERWRVDFGNKQARTVTGLLRRLAQGELA
jgi:hypothetical protein